MKRGEKLTAAELAMSVKDFAEANAGRWFYVFSVFGQLTGHGVHSGEFVRNRVVLSTSHEPLSHPSWVGVPGQVLRCGENAPLASLYRAILEPGDEGYAPEPQWRALTSEEQQLGVGDFCARARGWLIRGDDGSGRMWGPAKIEKVSPYNTVGLEGGTHASEWRRCEVRPPQSAPVTVQATGGQDANPYCRSRHDGWICTKPTGHADDHEAVGFPGRWPQVTATAQAVPDRTATAQAVPDRHAADKAAWDNLLKHADGACRYLAGRVHPGELTAYRREREGLVRELMAAIRAVQGKGVPR